MWRVVKMKDGQVSRVVSEHRTKTAAQKEAKNLRCHSGIMGLSVDRWNGTAWERSNLVLSRQMDFKQKVRDQEACRVTIIHCLDLLDRLREKLPNAVPDGLDPDGMVSSWLGVAKENLSNLVAFLVEHEL